MNDRPGEPGTAVYVHTPFCAVKCAYCNFASDVRQSGEGALFFDGLAAELAHHRRMGRLDGRRFDTLYLGGGTPTALAGPELERLFALLRGHLAVDPAAEVTSEANPESLTDEQAALLRRLGVNRLSLGAQSFHDDELAALNRPHDVAAIARAVRAARAAGFDNLSLDLIYGLPGQTLERWRTTLERALALGPDHLSCYCLILEPTTPLTADVKAGRRPRPDDDRQRDIFDWTVERLAADGWDFYELSNWARPGRRSEHNLRYWLGRPWLGLGPSAHSYLAGARAANPANLGLYHQRFTGSDPADPFRPVERDDLVFERIFMSLRLTEGLDLASFQREFGAPLEAFHPGTADRMIAQGWLERVAGHLRLTPAARFVSDGVFSEFAS